MPAATSTSVAKVASPLSYLATITAETSLVSYWRLGETTTSDPFTPPGCAAGQLQGDPGAGGRQGTTHGAYVNGPALGLAGAIAGDANTAAQFDGINDYGTVARQISDDFSIEFWFRSTQVFGTTCTSWWQGAGLVDAEVDGSASDFGVSLCAGKVVAGVGGSTDVSIVSPAGYNNGAWHHVVFTRSMTSGALELYVDGGHTASGTAVNRASLTGPAAINFGRIQTGTYSFAGSLDEVAVYNTVLTGTTVTTHFNAAQ